MTAPKKSPSSLTIANLRAKHDPRTVTRNKINAQFDRMRKRGDEYQYEQDFVRESGISPVYLRHLKAEFSNHIVTVVEIGKKYSRPVWFPNAAHARAIKKEQDAIKGQLAGPLSE